jgi:hypothetical protein
VKKDSTLVVKILFILLAILLVTYFAINNKENKKRYQWTEGYKAKSDQPYGTQFIQKLLKGQRQGQSFTVNDRALLKEVLDTTKIKVKTDYIFIGRNIFLSEDDKTALLNFISTGNDAFIASVDLPFVLIYSIFASECSPEISLVKSDTISVTLNFYNLSLQTQEGYTYSYRVGVKDERYFWNTINPQIFCDSTKLTIPLGYINPDKVNFIRFSFGKGYLYFHTNPIVFTNYFLTRADQAQYAANVFSHLNGRAVIWDEFSKSQYAEQKNANEISPISYILQQQSLKYAWWLMIASAILYTLFAAKRKQRAIPVLEEKNNTSLEFINMISALHFQNANHLNMAKKKIKYFYYFIKAKYGLHTQALSEIQLARLAEKSKVNLTDLQSVFFELNLAEKNALYNENRLVDLHRALEKFYKNCK